MSLDSGSGDPILQAITALRAAPADDALEEALLFAIDTLVIHYHHLGFSQGRTLYTSIQRSAVA